MGGPTNAAPTITSAASVSVAEGESFVIDVNATDPDAGQTLTYAIVGGADAALFTINPSNGLVAFAGPTNFEAPGDAGGDNVYNIVVRVTDNGAGALFAEQAIAVTVTNVNEAPTADGDGPYAATEDTVLTVTAANGVLAGDSDPDAGTTLTAQLVSPTANGALVLNADGSFTYSPNANFNGTDSFTYRASDGALTSATQTVTINVAPVNDAPDAVNDGGFSTAFNTALTIAPAALLANDSDGDPELAQTLTIQSVQGAVGGTVALAGGDVVFTPTAGFSGPASFTYTINDGAGGTDTATVRVNVASAPGGITTILGTRGNDPALTGGDGQERMYARAGDDSLDGGGGNDTLNGAQGNDTLTGGSGADQFRIDARETEGGSDTDTITDLNFAEGDTITLASFSPGTLAGVAGGNPLQTLAGGAGAILNSFADLVELDDASPAVSFTRLGSSETLVMKLVDGDGDVQEVRIEIAVGAFVAAGGTLGIPGLPSAPPPGANIVPGTSGPDNLLGTIGVDWIDGGDSADMIIARAGNDTLIGGVGNDTLNGAQGDDLLFGGADADRFRFDARDIAGGSDTDIVLDLAFAEGDTLVLAAFGAGTLQGVAGGNPLQIVGGGAGAILNSYEDLAELAAASASVTADRLGTSETLILSVTDTDGDVLNIQIANSFAAYAAAGGLTGV